jgi:hypothetical protein
MLNQTVFHPNPNIPMLAKLKLARKQEEASKSHQFHLQLAALAFKMPSAAESSQLPLMPPTGANIHLVFSTTVLPHSTTLFF